MYLDNAASTLRPQSVIDAVCHYYTENGANIHRGKHYLSEEASDGYERVRYQVAQFLGAFGNQIVFVKNTTEALNLVASGLGLRPDDVVVGSLDAHHAQILPWRRVARLELVRVDGEGRVDLEHFYRLLELRPKVVALTHCSNVTGALAPIEEMARAAKAACGAVVVVDAAQSLPHVRLNVAHVPVDFVAFSGHKMLAPSGVGCLFGRSDALDKLQPLILGGGAVDWVDTQGSQLRKVPHRFEAGTPAIASVLGLGAALRYLDGFGEKRLEEHDRCLTDALLRGAKDRDYIELIGPRDSVARCAILTFRVRGCDVLADVARALSDSYGMMCRSGHMCAQPVVDAHSDGEVLRASAYVYNSVAEIDAFYIALDEAVAWLAR